MNLAIQPLLAADCLSILVGFFGFIGFIVWVIVQIAKAIPKSSPSPPPAAAAPVARKPQGGSLQKEIDVFLRQVTPKGGNRPASEGGTAQVPPPPRRPATLDSRSNQTQQANRRESGSSTGKKGEIETLRSRSAKPGAELTARKGPGRENLGSEVREHVSRHMDSRPLGERVQEDLTNRVQQSVNAHLGESTGTLGRAPTLARSPTIAATSTESEASETATALGNAREFRRLLRQPEGIRQAILLNEILSRPLALRKSPDAR